ncbi:phytanoyl-CoA dioxygenase PhyH [Pseudonocardia sediminis]|uniref:Phytanoyl-CoA dioxygenase PhyH n=1 Tax=Pseudonocardia sediminis TaxID=1397368 RepID=A0A4Q7UVF2_PSEST|nr:phytanoyl-CoA dioxygenase family protein [Pseudonocardia sediminis]RZT85912.1 phytanoyl-CoA dioxygenase PhyH [Pseudonocardia sediminis]
MSDTTWSDERTEAFVRDGFVRVPEAFDRDLAATCRDLLWARTGADPGDPSTWTRPVVRIEGMSDEPFTASANTPALHTAFDSLVGPGRWRPRRGMGTFPIRFPHPGDPGDAGWHVEGSYAGPAGEMRLNLRSHGRALLMLFLYSDVGPDDAPTRIRVGSHRDVAALLAPYGEAGAGFFAFAGEAVPATDGHPVVDATGSAGDVYLVHPFVVHSVQPHRGTRPRFMAQPPLEPVADLDLDRPDGAHSPVERAVRLGFDRHLDARRR